jgi:BioD-like phosphotransacetylase family protein
MTYLQIAAYEPCGKTALCAGIGKKLANSGKKVGYIKPVHVTGMGSKDECLDAIFMNEALELGENKDRLCPLHISQEELWRSLSEDAANFSGKLKETCEKAASGKDILVIESPGAIKNDQVAALACYTMAEAIDARVILLICYSSDYREAEILQVAQKLAGKFSGIVLNQVPVAKLARVRDECAEFFKSNGVNVCGLLELAPGVTVGR